MTFLQLEHHSTNLLSEPYQGTGSDEDEFKKWAKASGHDPEGNEDDLAELGL